MTLLRYVAAASLAAILLGPPGSARAANIGWVWSDQPGLTPCYTPPAAWSYNSQGGAISVCSIPGDPAGSYYVTFSGLSPGAGVMDNAQVVAYDGNPAYGGHYCTLGSWGTSGSDVVATVFCATPATGAGYSMFTLFYQARSGDFGSSSNGIAYLLDDRPTQGSYTPARQYNSTGGTNTIVRNGTGNYTATIPGLQSTYSDVQVTEVNGGLPVGHCNVSYWRSSPGGGTLAAIQCYDGHWNAADRPFSLAYTVNEPFGLTTPSHSEGAWAWANDSGNTSRYTPSVFYQYNGFQTGYLNAQKLSTGEYAVYLPASVRVSTSNILVTAYGTSNICDVDEWSTSIIYVDCWNQNGAATDALFDVAFQTAE